MTFLSTVVFGFFTLAQAAPMDVVCKRISSDSVQNIVLNKVALPNGSGSNTVFYAPVQANEVRFAKPATIMAGANGQNLKDGECSFRDVGISPSFKQIQLDISGAPQISISTVRSGNGTTPGGNFNRFSTLSFKTLLFKAEPSSTGNVLTLKVDGGTPPTEL